MGGCAPLVRRQGAVPGQELGPVKAWPAVGRDRSLGDLLVLLPALELGGGELGGDTALRQVGVGLCDCLPIDGWRLRRGGVLLDGPGRSSRAGVGQPIVEADLPGAVQR